VAEATLVAEKRGDLRLDAAAKEARYQQVAEMIAAVIEPERDLLACLTAVVCLLHHAFPYYSWTGFYRRVGADTLRVGPYQGTLGCMEIRFGQGVCGAAAREGRSQLVADVNAFPGHIACDAASASEVVVPVFDAGGEVIAVLDVDSTLPAAFDATDQSWLERIVAGLALKQNQPVVATA
jgi:GAF domain-containing protein